MNLAGKRLHASCSPRLAFLWLSKTSTVRPTSTSASVAQRARSYAQAAPTNEERLVSLQTTEKRIAALAVGSLVIGYVTLKVAFSDVTLKKAPKEQKRSLVSDSGTGMGQPRPLVVAGPSGSGKSTLLKRLFKEYPNSFGFSVSHTTRSPRLGETDGNEYHFTTREKMKEGIGAGNFIEWAEFSGNMYGTSKRAVKDVQSTGKVCVLDIDIQGVHSMKKTDLNPVYVFIQPPSMQELEKRLRLRKTESEDSLRKRLQRAESEMKDAKSPGVFDHVIINDDLEEAYKMFRNTISQEVTFVNGDAPANSSATES